MMAVMPQHDLDSVKALVAELCEKVPPNGQELLLDLEHNGVRCILIRAQPRVNGNGLSPRECEIARLVAAGHPNKVIASMLKISSWTVSTHLRRIFTKLGVSSRAAMVAKWRDAGPMGMAATV